jgi:heat shock protein HtpX
MGNQLKTAALLGLLTGLVMLMGQAMGGRGGLMIAFVLAMVMNVGSYWFSDKIVLAMYRARELPFEDAPAVHRIVEELAAKASIPKPRIYLIPDDSPNAFATGRDPSHAAVAVTQGIMNLLSPEELKGVLAHELGHVKHRDILIQSVAGVLAGVIMYVANMLQWGAIFGMGRSSDDEEGRGGGVLGAIALAVIAPIAASLIQMAISRSREYLADDEGAALSDPLYLASALGKLDAYSRQVPMSEGSQATAHMFIVNPFSGRNMANLFSTHPPIEERIARLRDMAGHRGGPRPTRPGWS